MWLRGHGLLSNHYILSSIDYAVRYFHFVSNPWCRDNIWQEYVWRWFGVVWGDLVVVWDDLVVVWGVWGWFGVFQWTPFLGGLSKRR